MTWPIVELTFWNPGDGHNPRIDPLLADPSTPLAKHGLTGIATAYARENSVALHEAHSAWSREVAARTLAADGALYEVSTLFEREGVPFFLAKGPAIAYTAYADVALRPYCDLDLYVSPRNRWRAKQLLLSSGYAEAAQLVGPLGGQGRELFGGTYGAVVELHDSLVDNVHRHWLPVTDLALGHIIFQKIAGVSVPILSPPGHLALQLAHFAFGHRYAKLILLRDIATQMEDAEHWHEALGDLSPYASVVVEMLVNLGIPSRAKFKPSPGMLHKPLVAALCNGDPQSWDEYTRSPTNLLALLNHDSLRRTMSVAVRATMNALRAGGKSARVAGRPRCSPVCRGSSMPPVRGGH